MQGNSGILIKKPDEAFNFHLSTDIRLATGIKTPKIIEFVWMVVTPLLVIMILFFSIANYQRITYGTYEVILNS